jgi:hypothetical protein
MKTEQTERKGREDRGRSRMSSRMDTPGTEPRIEQQGFQSSRGQGPEGGQGHFGTSARLSDRGSDGRKDRGENKQELGSHGGSRRSRPSKGSSEQ